METVAANALVVESLRDGKPVRHVGVPPVEGGVEAGNLHDAGEALLDRANGVEVVRLVHRGERDQPLQSRQDVVVYRHRRRIVGTAVGHAVPDGHRYHPGQVLSKPGPDTSSGDRHVRDLHGRKRLIH